MCVSIDKCKEEAVYRMGLWGFHPKIIEQFWKDGLIYASRPVFGAYYFATGDQVERIRLLEQKYNLLVYHAICCGVTTGYKSESYLFVDRDHPDEWTMDREDIENNKQLVYASNYDIPKYSEFGYIGIDKFPSDIHGLYRTW